MLWLEKWTSEEFLDMLTGKLNMVISPLCSSNGIVGILFLVCVLLIFFFTYFIPWGGGGVPNKSHKNLLVQGGGASLSAGYHIIDSLPCHATPSCA